MKDKKFVALLSIFFILFLAGITLLAVEKPATQILRAKSSAPSPLKSFAIVFPQVTSVGKEVKVSVFVREVNGRVLPNRQVQLTASPPQVEVKPAEALTTNDLGQAEFIISSDTPGQIKLTAVELESNISISNIPSVLITQ